MFHGDNTKLKSPENEEAITETIKTRIKPISPPIRDKITASNKN